MEIMAIEDMLKYRFVNILHDISYYKTLSLFVERKRIKFSNLVVIGLGGSFVAAKAVLDIIPNCNNVRFIYFLDETVIRSSIKGLENDNTFFLFISKSGKTIEVISVYEILNQYGFTNFVFLTQNNNEGNSLRKIAKDGNYEILEHEDVSGRFSFTSNVFFIPALFAGLNVNALLDGFRNPIELDGKMNIFQKQFSILMCYDTRFEFFGHWYTQIFAESLGKKNFNCFPVTNIGTRDQHSVLEHHLNNPRNRFITFITKEISDFSMNIPTKHIVPNSNKHLSIQQIKDVELQATVNICNMQNLENRIIRLKSFNEYSVASLMMALAMEIIEIAEKCNINPFTQEMVEQRKILSYKILANILV